MKKTLISLGLVLSLTACGEKPAEKPADATNAPAAAPAPAPAAPAAAATEKKAEHYFVGTDAAMPPFTFKDEQGQMTGFDIEILRAIADNQGFSVDLMPTKRSELFNELGEGKYQILAANLGINPERLAKSEMSKPYVWAPNVIMGKQGSTAKTLAEVGDGRVGVQKGSYSHDVVTKAGIKNIVPVDSLYNAYAALARGEVDYVVGDAGALNNYHNSNPKAAEMPVYASVYDKNEDVSVGYAVQKGNVALIEKINAGLANIRANGKYDEIYKKYFGEDKSLIVPADKM